MCVGGGWGLLRRRSPCLETCHRDKKQSLPPRRMTLEGSDFDSRCFCFCRGLQCEGRLGPPCYWGLRCLGVLSSTPAEAPGHSPCLGVWLAMGSSVWSYPPLSPDPTSPSTHTHEAFTSPCLIPNVLANKSP